MWGAHLVRKSTQAGSNGSHIQTKSLQGILKDIIWKMLPNPGERGNAGKESVPLGAFSKEKHNKKKMEMGRLTETA